MAPLSCARARLALLRFAPERSAPASRAPVSLASWKFASLSLAPVRSAPVRSRRLKLAPVRSQPGQALVRPARKSSRGSARGVELASVDADAAATSAANTKFRNFADIMESPLIDIAQAGRLP